MKASRVKPMNRTQGTTPPRAIAVHARKAVIAPKIAMVQARAGLGIEVRLLMVPLPNESRLSCGALKKNSFHNLRAPAASSAC